MPQRLLKPKEIAEVFARFSAADPDPKTELEYLNPFTLLVAIVLSAQATDVSVNKATPPLFAIADTPEKMARLGEEEIKRHIRTIGLYNAKARNVALLSEMLVKEYCGEVPTDRAALETLPGVGSKTAAVWLNNVLGAPTIAVDTHVFRVSNRLGICATRTADQTEAALNDKVPDKYKLHAHHWLILHGRYTCKARRPECPRCIQRDICTWPEKTV